MKVTILGSCTVIDYPNDAYLFVKNDHLVDIRNGFQMEMDVLPLYFLALNANDQLQMDRLNHALINNLQNSEIGLWQCGVWGYEEVHFRFTSIAIRLWLFYTHLVEKQKLISCLIKHISYQEPISEGVWFFHDSIEYNKEPFYAPWNGSSCLKASENNMLILNTHIDTLVTLLIAKETNVEFDELDKQIQQGLLGLYSFYQETKVVAPFLSRLDAFFRNISLLCLGRGSRISLLLSKVLNRLYFSKFRLFLKRRINIRAFSDGYLERDIRLPSNNFEYHVVNIWDLSKLLFWMNINDVIFEDVYDKSVESILNGLKYCFNSRCYTYYLKSISQKKGNSNEVLESIAILYYLGIQESWLETLYLQYRRFAPPSCGILGLDLSVSGIKTENSRIHVNIDGFDLIEFPNGRIFWANNTDYDNSVDNKGVNNRIICPANSIGLHEESSN